MNKVADEIIIGNVGGQDGVASEVTLQALVRAVEKLAKNNGTSGSNSSAKVEKLYTTAKQEGTKATADQTQEIKDNTDELKESTSALNTFGNKLGNLAAQGIAAAGATLVNWTKELINGKTSVTDFAQHIPVIGSTLAQFTQYLDDSMQSFQRLSMSGASFNNDLTQLRGTAAELRMNLTDFTSFVGNNSERLAGFGGTVTDGVNQVKRLNSALGSQREEMLNMGFTMTDINEALLEYAAINRAGTRAQARSLAQTQQEALAAADYAKNLQTLAKLTGQDVKSMQDKLAAQANDVAFQMKLAKMRPDERAKVLAGLQEALALGGETGAEFFKQQILGIGPVTERTALFAATMGESAGVIQNMANAARDASVSVDSFNAGTTERMLDFVEGAANSGQRLEAVLSAASAGLDGPGKEIAAILQGMGKQFTDYMNEDGSFNREALKKDIEQAQKEQAARADTTKAMSSFNEQVTRLQAALQKLLIDSGILDALAKGITFVADTFGAVADGIKGLPDAIKGPAVVAAIVAGFAALFATRALVSGLTNSLKGAVESRVSRALGTNATAPMSSPTAPGAGRNAIQAAPAAAPRGGAAAAGGGGAMASAGKTIGDFGKGIGKGIEGILKGLAKGVSAFANPLFLVGAAKLSLGIVLVGGAVAGATWMMGKALPTFAEGLRSFADIDGDNLLQVAKGIAGVGAALAAFGAGAAIGAVGNVIANVLEALPGKGPMDRLVEFSNLNIDAKKVEANANAMAAYGRALGALGAGSVSGSLGTVAANLIGGIAGFFGGSAEPNWSAVEKFGSYNINVENVRNNAEATVAYANAMSALAGAPTPRLLGTLVEGVRSFFGLETPWDKLASFGSIRLDREAITSNAQAAVAYANAMSALATVPTPGLLGTLVEGVRSFFNLETPWDKLVSFGSIRLDAESIRNNATAAVAYANAMSALASVPVPGLLSTLVEGVRGFFGIETPWDKLVSFSNLTIGPNVATNARAMALFADAMRNVPEVRSERTGGLMGAISNFFGGSEVMPWDRLRAFGDLQINAENVAKNAQALSGFGNAIRAFQGGEGGSIGISADVITSMERLANVNNRGGLEKTAAGFAAMGASSTPALLSVFNSLKDLDANALSRYNTALENLAETLKTLNEELAKDNKGIFGGGSGVSAADALKSISVNTSNSAGNSGQLNETMIQIRELLTQIKSIDEDIKRNTGGLGGNIAARDITVM